MQAHRHIGTVIQGHRRPQAGQSHPQAQPSTGSLIRRHTGTAARGPAHRHTGTQVQSCKVAVVHRHSRTQAQPYKGQHMGTQAQSGCLRFSEPIAHKASRGEQGGKGSHSCSHAAAPPPRLCLSHTRTSRNWLSAFTTLMPTPCRPPDTLYPLDSPPNLPPACSTVSTCSGKDGQVRHLEGPHEEGKASCLKGHLGTGLSKSLSQAHP